MLDRRCTLVSQTCTNDLADYLAFRSSGMVGLLLNGVAIAPPATATRQPAEIFKEIEEAFKFDPRITEFLVTKKNLEKDT